MRKSPFIAYLLSLYIHPYLHYIIYLYRKQCHIIQSYARTTIFTASARQAPRGCIDAPRPFLSGKPSVGLLATNNVTSSRSSLALVSHHFFGIPYSFSSLFLHSTPRDHFHIFIFRIYSTATGSPTHLPNLRPRHSPLPHRYEFIPQNVHENTFEYVFSQQWAPSTWDCRFHQ
jgi:hypothetical protein